MHRRKLSPFLVLLVAGTTLASPSAMAAQGDGQCSGHQLLATPRAEGSCLTIRAQVYPSPDKALRAIVFPVDMDLHTTPDMESRVVIRGPDANLLTSKDYSSPRGEDGYYVVNGRWSPDSQFFVYSMSSSGGHSPWSFPIWVYSREKNLFASFSDMIGGAPTVSGDFSFSAPHTVTATTLEKIGSDKQVPVVVDLEDAIAKLAAASGN